MRKDYENMFKKEFEIILAAGEAKNSAMEAIQKAQEFEFDEALTLLQKSEREVVTTHKYEQELITEEANGTSEHYGILMMHAQDHLTTAIIFLEMAQQLIKVYQHIDDLKKENNNLSKALRAKQ